MLWGCFSAVSTMLAVVIVFLMLWDFASNIQPKDVIKQVNELHAEVKELRQERKESTSDLLKQIAATRNEALRVAEQERTRLEQRMELIEKRLDESEN